MIRWLSMALAVIQAFILSVFPSTKNNLIVNTADIHQTIESFGTSSAWWSQMIDSDDMAREIAKKLYSDEEGLGLDVYRYNIGGGENDNPETRIWDRSRRTESFYVQNENGEWVYDFTRDANAVRMMKYAVEYGADRVILFCNSPHYSMTKSGHASGGFEDAVSNLPEENYDEFIDYVLTIADHFVEEGIPVYAISPINEPQWGWGGEWVGQEGCHYTVEETVKLLEMFATEMQKRNVSYKLSGTESGQLNWMYYDYTDKFFESEILNNYCDSFSGHSYWIDNQLDTKKSVGDRFAKLYPDKKFEMSEWCELPMTINSDTIDSGIYMANIIAQDLTLLDAVSWQSWTAVNGDGLLDIIGGELHEYNRYYAYKQFASFIEPGMKRIGISQSKDNDYLACAAFKNADKYVIIVINNSEDNQKISLQGITGKAAVYTTDKDHNCAETASAVKLSSVNLSARSINTIVVERPSLFGDAC